MAKGLNSTYKLSVHPKYSQLPSSVEYGLKLKAKKSEQPSTSNSSHTPSKSESIKQLPSQS